MQIGDVVDARSSGSKQVLNGKEYDYIFGKVTCSFLIYLDVDIGDGTMRKLGYNNTGLHCLHVDIFCCRKSVYSGPGISLEGAIRSRYARPSVHLSIRVS